jgi:hypothetical protein
VFSAPKSHRKVQLLDQLIVPLVRQRLQGTEPISEVVECPDCDDGMDSILVALGLLAARVA